MKKIFAILLILALLWSFAACAGNSGEDSLQALENPALGFAFSYPKDWMLTQNDLMIQIIRESGDLTNITAFELPLDGSLEDYLAGPYRENLGADLKGLVMENENLIRENDHVRWISFIYTAQYAAGDESETGYRFMQSFAQNGSRAAVLTLCAPKDQFGEYNKLFEGCLDSFRFTEKQSQTALSQDSTVTNDAVEYVITRPEGWEVIRNDGMIALRAGDGSTVTTAAFNAESTVTSLDQYMDDYYLKDLRASMGEVKLIGDYEAVLVDGKLSGLTCQYTARVNGVDYRFYQLLASRAGYIYSYLYTASEENFALHLEDVQKIFDSVSFTKG